MKKVNTFEAVRYKLRTCDNVEKAFISDYNDHDVIAKHAKRVSEHAAYIAWLNSTIIDLSRKNIIIWNESSEGVPYKKLTEYAISILPYAYISHEKT